MIKALHRWSLQRTLLVVLMPGLVAVMGLEIVVSWRSALGAANAAFDRSLLGAIKSIDANISTASGGLSVELPYRLLEFFELTANGQVFYRVVSGDGLVEIGNADLPMPELPLVDGQARFTDASYFGQSIRLGSYARRLAAPLSSGSQSDRVVIQVGETLESRQDFTRQLVLEAVARDVLLLAAAVLLLVAAVRFSLEPLQRLRERVAARDPQDLQPLQAQDVPQDVQPLVQAIDLHMARYRDALEARRRFLDDASHQLRTPLTTLSTQMAYVLREADPARVQQALQAIKAQLDEAIRQTNQMLALGRADSMELRPEATDLVALAESATLALWPLARERHIDLGLERLDPGPVEAMATAGLIREALTNLLHNALRHAPEGSPVTVMVGREKDARERAWCLIRVVDLGPGIPTDQRAHVGERFFRVGGTPGDGGTGLGLAIARAIVLRHGGELDLAPSRPDEALPGLTVTMRLPALDS